MQKQNLQVNFLDELAQLAILNKDYCELISMHLKDEYIQNDEYKEIFKTIFNYYHVNGNSPTIGELDQKLVYSTSNDKNFDPILAKIAKSYVGDTKTQQRLLKEFEVFIRKYKYVELHDSVARKFNSGDVDGAITSLDKESRKLSEFSLLSRAVNTVYGGYDQRSFDRMMYEAKGDLYVPTGIMQFDHHSHGGMERGRSLLGIARSGGKKSFFLRWLGFTASFNGWDVIHFQGEGTEKEIMEYYDAMWTQVNIESLKYDTLNDEEKAQIALVLEEYKQNHGEIFVVPFEQFDKANLRECRQYVIDIKRRSDLKKKKGKKGLGLLLFDYLEKFNPGDKINYGGSNAEVMSRKLAIAEGITNMAVEFSLAAATTTQASDIKPEFWNNETFVIRRNHIANLKATIDAFSYCLTFNQTTEEEEDSSMRIHEEKSRSYWISVNDRTYKIKGGYDKHMFCDIEGTKAEYWDDEQKKIK